MAEQHRHPDEGEPRAHGETHHEDLRIDINTASEDQLAELPMVGRERARLLAQHRPFRSWEDVERIPGFSSGMVDDLKSAGVRLQKKAA